MNTITFSHRPILATFACVGLLAASAPASAAIDYFLKFDDTSGIVGSSVAKGHEKAIEFESFSWGVSNSSTPLGGAGGAGKPTFRDFQWTQAQDSSVTGLFDAVFNGDHIKKATVDFTTSIAGAAPQTYFRMTFDDVIVNNVDLSGGGSSFLQLAGSFNYAKILLEYWVQDPKTGKLAASPLKAAYDLKLAQGSVGAVAAMYAQGLAGPQVTAVPEPETYAMLLAGLGVIGAVARRRRQVA